MQAASAIHSTSLWPPASMTHLQVVYPRWPATTVFSEVLLVADQHVQAAMSDSNVRAIAHCAAGVAFGLILGFRPGVGEDSEGVANESVPSEATALMPLAQLNPAHPGCSPTPCSASVYRHSESYRRVA